jgi:hypothetical protein
MEKVLRVKKLIDSAPSGVHRRVPRLGDDLDSLGVSNIMATCPQQHPAHPRQFLSDKSPAQRDLLRPGQPAKGKNYSLFINIGAGAPHRHLDNASHSHGH